MPEPKMRSGTRLIKLEDKARAASEADPLRMLDRVIDWRDLTARAILVLRRRGYPLEDVPLNLLFRTLVLRELHSIPQLEFLLGASAVPEQARRAFLGLGPFQSPLSDAELATFAEEMQTLDGTTSLRQALVAQLDPWFTFLLEFRAAPPPVIARAQLAALGNNPARRLVRELESAAQWESGTASGRPKASGMRLPERLGADLDSIVTLGYSLTYETGRIASKTGIQRLILSQAWQRQRKLTTRNKNRLIDRGLPAFDAFLRSLLRGVGRDMVPGEQTADPMRKERSGSERLRKIAMLLSLRTRLFMAAGDYDRAYLFSLASAAWRQDDSPTPVWQAGNAAHLGGRFREAETLYREALLYGVGSAAVIQNLAHVVMVTGREREASSLLRRAAHADPSRAMAHQNMAGLYDPSQYALRPLDRVNHPQTLLYDAYNLAGERLVHIGAGERGVECYGAALRKQEELARSVRLPVELRKILSDGYGVAEDEPVRILPYEWVTLIGHIAMLDSYLKLQKLGMGKPGKALLLAPAHKVANRTYLNRWRKHVVVIEDPLLVDDLFAYQRAFGDCFNGYLRPDGSAGDWTELGALGQIAWDAAGQGPLIHLPDWLREQGEHSLRSMGLGPSDWFVALHIRGTGFHQEGKRSMQTHRNAAIEDYVRAMKAIVDAGGWVIRMGDASMDPLPAMERVVDYPSTRFKSEECDIFLAGAAKFFIGTTSGLMNTVMSFGTPSLLVNCISNYFQLWNNRVLFTLKPLWHGEEKRYLSIAEMTAESLRWKIFNINRLIADGIEPHANSAEEIEAATKEMIERLRGGVVMGATEADEALKEQCVAGGNRNYFGNGRISNTFYHARRQDLFRGSHVR